MTRGRRWTGPRWVTAAWPLAGVLAVCRGGELKIAPGDAAPEDHAAASVSIHGDALVLGVHGDDDNGIDAGAAWVFRRGAADWAPEAKLAAPDGSAHDRFGLAVSMHSHTVAVGAFRRSRMAENAGAAYVFARSDTNWFLQAVLDAGQPCPWEGFGRAIALGTNTLVVGAPFGEHAGARTGAAYVFARSGTNWTREARLVSESGEAWDQFGYAVAVDGDRAAVGAPHADAQGPNSGLVHVFTRSGTNWTREATLMPGDGGPGDLFGWSVAMDGGCVVAGAYGDDDQGGNAGAAYAFVRGGSHWTQQAKLLPADGCAGAAFGWSVSLAGGLVAVGARRAADNGPYAGSAYVFARSGEAWSQAAKLLAADGQAWDVFGSAVSVWGTNVLVGADAHAHAGPRSGAAYLFSGSW